MLKEQILNAIPVLSDVEDAYTTVVAVDRDNLVQAVMDLASKCKYDGFLDMSVVEYEEDFVGVYNLMNFVDMDELRLEVHFPKDDAWLPSLTGVFKACIVLERESYDLMGVEYKGHPDLRRIFLPDDFVGHPLRKEYNNPIRK